MQRLIIFAKDITVLTGRSPRYGRKIIKEVRLKNGKTQHQFVTLPEFCEYMGLKEEEVAKRLG